MDTLITLSAVELERLLMTIESSQQVHRRSQYFLWSQGVLQSFLPHDLLIFGHGEYGAPGFQCEVLARTNTWQDIALNIELNGLVQQIVESWQGNRNVPRAFRAGDAMEGACNIGQTLDRLGLGHALAHGAKEFSGNSTGFFIFLGMPELPGRRHTYFVEMLMPYLHTSLHRMLISEKEAPCRRAYSNMTLTPRESQVIGFVRDGMTNKRIAETLELSPLTVKNHVQNILQKLDAGNRAQAVAKAVNARLINAR